MCRRDDPGRGKHISEKRLESERKNVFAISSRVGGIEVFAPRTQNRYVNRGAWLRCAAVARGPYGTIIPCRVCDDSAAERYQYGRLAPLDWQRRSAGHSAANRPPKRVGVTFSRFHCPVTEERSLRHTASSSFCCHCGGSSRRDTHRYISPGASATVIITFCPRHGHALTCAHGVRLREHETKSQ